MVDNLEEMEEELDPRLQRRRDYDKRLLKWNGEIGIGTLVVIGSIIVTSVIGVYTVRSDIDRAIEGVKGRQDRQDDRIEALSTRFTNMQNEETAFRAEVRGSITNTRDSIADMRVEIVKSRSEEQRRPPAR